MHKMSITQPDTTYVNGGVTNGLRKLFTAHGWRPSHEEALTMAAHASFPAGVEYTETELEARRAEIAASQTPNNTQI